MGRIAEVKSSTRVVDEGAQVLDVAVDPGGQAQVTATHYADPGDDSRPLPGDSVALETSSGTGNAQATGYLDPKVTPVAGEGEKRIYARSAPGVVVASIHLKADGSIVVTNEAGGSIEMQPSGDVIINGVTIDTDGNVTTTGEVTAGVSGIPLSTHIHPHPFGPTSGPTPPPAP